jgi:hypothetical protein
MKVYRSYWCDFGHTWEVYVDEDALETEADVICPQGHEAVTCKTEIPADLVRLTILPAARIIGEGNLQRLYGERKFHVSISDREGVLLRTSKSTYTFRDAVNTIERFTNKTAAEACAYWDHIHP